MSFIYKTIRIILIIIPILVLVFLLNKEFAPLGRLEFEHDFKKQSPFIDRLLPSGRARAAVCEKEFCYQEIVGEPVYFDLFMPRQFEKAKILVEFKSENQDVFEMGLQAGTSGWQYKTVPLGNKLLDFLEWGRIEEGGLTLFQKEKTYDSIEDFLINLPEEKIGVYNFDINKDFKILEYQKSENQIEIQASLKGPHSWFTYIKDENLNFEFSLKKEQEGSVEVLIFTKAGNLIHSEEIKDRVKINIPDLEEGVYKIETRIGKKDLIYDFKSQQHLLSFIGKIDLGYDPYSASKELYTESYDLAFQILEIEARQNVRIGDEELLIEEIGKMYKVGSETGLRKIEIQNPGIQISGDGLFSFSKESYFNPINVVKVKDRKELDQKNVNFILAKYNSPKDLGDGWRVGEVDLPILGFDKEKELQKMIFIASDILENNGSIKIRRIKVLLEKEPWDWEWIKSKF